MKKRSLAAALLAGLLCSGAGSRGPAPWGDTVDGLACRVLMPNEFCVGEAIHLAVEIKNVSQETRYLVSIFDILYPKHARMDIAGPGGPMGGPSQRAETTPMPGSLQPIAPDQVVRVEFADLARYFSVYDPRTRSLSSRFETPGAYRLTYSFFGLRLPKQMAVGERITEGKAERIYQTIPEEKWQKTWAGTLVSNVAAFAVRELREEEFQVHEWGVFTIFNDVKYANANRKAEWGSVPDFFYRQFPTRRLKWEPAAWDKPILYFHCTRPTLKVDVKLTFVEGAPVVWWPCASRPVDDSVGRRPGQEGGPGSVLRTLEWSAWLGERVPVLGTSWGRRADKEAWQRVSETELPQGSWLRDARLKEASLVTVSGTKTVRSAPWASHQTETERFIYYDGLVPAPGLLRCTKAAADSITVKNAARFPIRDLFLVDNRAVERDGPQRWARVAAPIAPGEERTIALEEVRKDRLLPAKEETRKALVAAGLTEAEAAAVLRIWDVGFFSAPRVTAFYLLPQAEYDRMLPLEIRPAPKRIVRVGIALHPLFADEPWLAERAAQLIAQLSDATAERRELAAKGLAELGPVAWRALREALGKNPPPTAARLMDEILKSTDAADWLRQATKSYEF